MAAEKTAEKTALVIMAAGLGNRYGGLKQLEPVGANGEFIIDYSIYDALAAGCGKIVFVIRRENLAQFRDTVGRRAERAADTAYAFQELGDLPAGISIPGGLPQGRAKQWGTAHAVYCARHEAGGRDMIVVNADDFYGRGTFAALAGFLAGGRLAEADAKAETGAKAEASAKAGASAEAKAETGAKAEAITEIKAGAEAETGAEAKAGAAPARAHYCMAGFLLENTLSQNGHVSRGVCQVGGDGLLAGIEERTRIQENGGAVQSYENGAWTDLPRDAVVSMNCWGFTQAVFGDIEAGFGEFFRESGAGGLMTAEYFLPDAIRRAIAAGRADVAVLRTPEKWRGVTYREDRELVARHVAACAREGLYPPSLWA